MAQVKQDEVSFYLNQAAYVDNLKELGKKNAEQKTIAITVVSKKTLGRFSFRSETQFEWGIDWDAPGEMKTLAET